MKVIRHPPLKLADHVSEKDEADLAHDIHAILQETMHDVIKSSKLTKAEPAEDADEPDELDLRRLRGLIRINEKTGQVAVKSSRRALEQWAPEATYTTVDKNAIEWARDRAASLIGMRYNRDGELVPAARSDYRIDDSTREMLRDTLRQAVEDGLSSNELQTQLSEDYAFSLDRALTIARTEMAYAHSEGQMIGYKEAQKQTGIKLNKLWLLGEEACELCEENADAGPIPLEDEFPSGDDNPPAHPNCLPEGSLVTPGSRIVGAVKRWYKGKLVILRTATGNCLSITPNHPVLTDRGFTAAGLLDVGSNVVGQRRRGSFAQRYPNNQDMPTCIEQITDAFFSSCDVVSHSPSSADDFHGDGMASDVAIIGTNCLLGRAGNPSLPQEKEDLTFEGAVVKEQAFPGFSFTEQLVGTSGPAPNSVVGCSAVSSMFLRGPLSTDDAVGFGDAAQNRTLLLQAEHQGDSVAPDPFSEAIEGCATFVFFDKIIEVLDVDFAGHVYNLQTEWGWYIAQGIVIHNCRCDVATEEAEPGDDEGEDED